MEIEKETLKKWARGIAVILLGSLVYIAGQAAATGLGGGLAMLVNHKTFKGVMTHLDVYAGYLLWANVICDLMVIVVLVKLKWAVLACDYFRPKKNRITILWLALFALTIMLPELHMQEILDLGGVGEATDKFLEGAMTDPFGVMSIGIIVPIVEEVLFRGVILGTLLKLLGQKNHWWAILISAFLFGGFHGNMAQFVSAGWAGILYGWVAYRTKSLIPSIVLHAVGNSAACILALVTPDDMDEISDLFSNLFHGDLTTMYIALGVLFCAAMACLSQIIIRVRRG